MHGAAAGNLAQARAPTGWGARTIGQRAARHKQVLLNNIRQTAFLERPLRPVELPKGRRQARIVENCACLRSRPFAPVGVTVTGIPLPPEIGDALDWRNGAEG